MLNAKAHCCSSLTVSATKWCPTTITRGEGKVAESPVFLDKTKVAFTSMKSRAKTESGDSFHLLNT